ncbi:Flp pilus assembly protein TadG [Desulfitispora alkaliphila]|uniref:TadE family protein n=1 Tax=Desulfitispora alkaliphila TaxID=622674 RepID=UPI003D255878
MIEFALVLPILILIMFCIIDLSRIAFHNNLINQAARETARQVSTGKDINSVVNNLEAMLQPIFNSSSSSISVGTNDDNQQSTVIIWIVNSKLDNFFKVM